MENYHKLIPSKVFASSIKLLLIALSSVDILLLNLMLFSFRFMFIVSILGVFAALEVIY
jgi:hypothetical protein